MRRIYRVIVQELRSDGVYHEEFAFEKALADHSGGVLGARLERAAAELAREQAAGIADAGGAGAPGGVL